MRRSIPFQRFCYNLACCAVFLALFPVLLSGQAVSPPVNNTFDPAGISIKAIGAIDKSISSVREKLLRKSTKTLARLQKQEARMAAQLRGRDSTSAQQLMAAAGSEYRSLTQRLQDPQAQASLKNYIPSVDSMQTLLTWLGKQDASLSQEQRKAIGNATESIKGLQGQLQAAADIKTFVLQRKAQWQAALEKTGLGKCMKNFKKETYYYQAQVNEYKQFLSDPDKLAEKLLSLARNTDAFKAFMSSNSMLAQLFPAPSASAVPLAGLQTRASVQQILQQAGGSSNPQQYLQQQFGQAQAQMNALKDKINKAGGGSSDFDMPDFKPNQQKTKSFWKRIEYGLNIQSQRPNSLLPVTSDIAFTLGYKLNDKSVVGIGAGYKIGWGKDISNIRLTSEGCSLRSYLDFKLKGSLWISGGYEYNYLQSFSSIDQLKNADVWQKSGLIGLSKKYKVGKKNGNLQLLWDFLSYEQMPRSAPLKFRVGYVF